MFNEPFAQRIIFMLRIVKGARCALIPFRDEFFQFGHYGCSAEYLTMKLSVCFLLIQRERPLERVIQTTT